MRSVSYTAAVSWAGFTESSLFLVFVSSFKDLIPASHHSAMGNNSWHLHCITTIQCLIRFKLLYSHLIQLQKKPGKIFQHLSDACHWQMNGSPISALQTITTLFTQSVWINKISRKMYNILLLEWVKSMRGYFFYFKLTIVLTYSFICITSFSGYSCQRSFAKAKGGHVHF